MVSALEFTKKTQSTQVYKMGVDLGQAYGFPYQTNIHTRE